jgi:hypothetical protein
MKKYIIPKMKVYQAVVTDMINLSQQLISEDSDDLILDAKEHKQIGSPDIWEEY